MKMHTTPGLVKYLRVYICGHGMACPCGLGPGRVAGLGCDLSRLGSQVVERIGIHYLPTTVSEGKGPHTYFQTQSCAQGYGSFVSYTAHVLLTRHTCNARWARLGMFGFTEEVSSFWFPVADPVFDDLQRLSNLFHVRTVAMPYIYLALQYHRLQ